MTVRVQTTTVATYTATAAWSDAPVESVMWIRIGGVDYGFGADDYSAAAILNNNDSYAIPVGTRYNLAFTPDGGSRRGR